MKTFAKQKNGATVFFKDGYTDLRGRFDYASANSSDLDCVEKFALFVMSDQLGSESSQKFTENIGSLMKEVKPPSTMGKLEVGMRLFSNKMNELAQQKLFTQQQNYFLKKDKK